MERIEVQKDMIIKIITFPIKVVLVIWLLLISPIVATVDYLTSANIYNSTDYFWSWDFKFRYHVKKALFIFKEGGFNE